MGQLRGAGYQVEGIFRLAVAGVLLLSGLIVQTPDY